ncbi:DMT family transporter [Antarctobacter jejuensis]|uniref:DMT family transporter n=1 Tax=Antarctobacter jejuensis TaxID=1439938 RepID=UPI003FCF7EEF
MAQSRWGMNPDRSELAGVSLMLLASGLGAVDAALIKLMSGGVHPFVMGFTRSLFGLLVVLPWILSRPGILKSNYRFRHVLRAALKLASLLAYFVAFATAPLANVTAIAFTAPIFVTVGAWVFLGETPRALRIAAVAIGFVGVLIVLSPGRGAGVSSGLLFALLGALLTALIQLILKPMSARDSTETLVAWNLIATVPIAAIPALFVWQTPTGTEWMLLALQGALGALAMGCVTRAFYYAEASLIGPVDFLRLPFVAVLGYFFFGQVVQMSTWIGGMVIFVATILMARSARRSFVP